MAAISEQLIKTTQFKDVICIDPFPSVRVSCFNLCCICKRKSLHKIVPWLHYFRLQISDLMKSFIAPF
jgi:hypothetical protein